MKNIKPQDARQGKKDVGLKWVLIWGVVGATVALTITYLIVN